jgi:DeoR/GlpR family transcriptional regulator of sugar metabolism
MIDAGSTTNQFARRLVVAGRELTVFTNSLPVATTLGQNSSIDVILCPGDLLAEEAAVYGDETVAFLHRFHADRCFIGAGGIAAEGVMDVNRAATGVKRAMLRQSEKAHLLIDHSKFDLRLVSIVEPLSSIDALIADEAPTGALAQALAAEQVEIVVAAGKPKDRLDGLSEGAIGLTP